MRQGSIVRSAAGIAVAFLLAVALAPRTAFAQTQPTLTALNASSISLRAGGSRLLRVRLDLGGVPGADQTLLWEVVSTTAGAWGPASSVTDSAGVASATFRFPRPGVTTIRVSWAQAPTGVPPVIYTITSTAVPPPPPPPPGETRFTIAPVSPGQVSLVLGDRYGLQVRLVGSSGQPVSGVPVKFAVESTAGSPGVGRSDQTVATGSDGVATATFGFSTAGRVTIRASSGDAAFVFDPESVVFTIDVSSLGTLTPERQTWRTAGEALDAICLDVFVDENGEPRPVPQPTPLCVYMTGTLTTQEERTEAIHSFSATGLGSQATTALAGVEQQTASIQSRLAALRGGALRGAVDRIALVVDGVEISTDALAEARAQRGRSDLFSTRLEDSFARLYAGLDAQETPAQEPAAAPPAQRERPWGFFATGRLTTGSRDAGVEEDGFDFDSVGATVGIDRAVSANGFLGAAVSGLSNETTLEGAGGSLDAESWGLTLYGIREGEKGYFQLTATYGQSRFDQRRLLPMPAIGDLTARAEFDGDQLAADLELGRSFDGRAGSLTFFVRGGWARATIDGFTEQGAVAELPGFGAVDFGLEVGDQELESLLGAAGLDWGKAFSIRGGLVIPQLTATWSHEFDDDAQAVSARFLGDQSAGSSFFVFTDDPDRDWLTAAAALRFQFLWGSVFVAYDQEVLRDDLDLSTVNAGLRFEF
jgi:uncharacterized protein YhjY with autotransporter beta-barrel domain